MSQLGSESLASGGQRFARHFDMDRYDGQARNGLGRTAFPVQSSGHDTIPFYARMRGMMPGAPTARRHTEARQ